MPSHSLTKERPASAPGAPSFRNLLERPAERVFRQLDAAMEAIAATAVIPSSHRKELPFAVRDLSRLLTQERGDLARSYWAAPRLASAYMHFFLPWNLCRLAWLLPNLFLPLKKGDHILDLGSGPLTFALALWCARPDLHTTELVFHCGDVAAKPLEHGEKIFKSLAGENAPWRIEPFRSPFEKTLRAFSGKELALVCACNALNEVVAKNAQAGAGKNAQQRETPLAQRLEMLVNLAKNALSPEGRLLLIEPGTRLGGKLVALSRKAAIENGFSPLAPCTHSGPCPMLDEAEQARTPHSPRRYSGWCHFTHPAAAAPQRLLDLGQKAHMEKESLALSCIFLQNNRADTAGQPDTLAFAGSAATKAAINGPALSRELAELEALYQEIMDEPAYGAPRPNELTYAARSNHSHHPTHQAHSGNAVNPASSASSADSAASVKDGTAEGSAPSKNAALRVVSSPIRLPGYTEPARYACCERGVALLLDALRIPSGAYVSLPWPERERLDGKTGALVFERPASSPRTGSGKDSGADSGTEPAKRPGSASRTGAAHKTNGSEPQGKSRKTTGATAMREKRKPAFKAERSDTREKKEGLPPKGHSQRSARDEARRGSEKHPQHPQHPKSKRGKKGQAE